MADKELLDPSGLTDMTEFANGALRFNKDGL